MNFKEQVKQEAKEAYENALEETGDTESAFFQAFNEDYYIIGIYEAEKFIESYGFFDACRLIKDHDMEPDIDNPEQFASQLWYAIGMEVTNGYA